MGWDKAGFIQEMENRGYDFKVSGEEGSLLYDGEVVADVTSEDPMNALLLNVGEREGMGLAHGYGIKQGEPCGPLCPTDCTGAETAEN